MMQVCCHTSEAKRNENEAQGITNNSLKTEVCIIHLIRSFRKNNNFFQLHIDGSVQERRNASASAMELRLSCTNPSIYSLETFKSHHINHTSAWVVLNIRLHPHI